MPANTSPHARYRLKAIGSSLDSWAIERDGIIWASHPSALYLGAFLDAVVRGASDDDARLVAQAVYSRPEPTYEERMAHFAVTGPWLPARDPYSAKRE